MCMKVLLSIISLTHQGRLSAGSCRRHVTHGQTLASILRKARHGVRLNEHLELRRAPLCSSKPARWGWRGRLKAAWDRATGLVVRRTGSNSRIRRLRR
jgi:hypothetical protein